MQSYEKWYEELSDLTHWTEAKATEKPAKQKFAKANHHKIAIAVGIWEPGQWCPFL